MRSSAAIAEESRRAERAPARYYAAFETGDLDPERFDAHVSALEARLDTLREQESDRAQQTAATTLVVASAG